MTSEYSGPLVLTCKACGGPVHNEKHHFSPPVKVACDNKMVYTHIRQPTTDRTERGRAEARSAVADPVEDAP